MRARATRPRSAAGPAARAAGRNGAWSSRRAPMPSPARTAPGSPSCPPARAAAPRTSSTTRDCAPGAACGTRATVLLSGGTGDVPATMSAVLEANCGAPNPRSALNWLRKGDAAALLAEIAAGRTAATHEALDVHPPPRAAGAAADARQRRRAAARDEELARAEQWLAALLSDITRPRAPPARPRVRDLARDPAPAPRRRSQSPGPGPAPPTPGTPSRQQPGSWPGSPSAGPPWPAAARPRWTNGWPPAPAPATSATS